MTTAIRSFAWSNSTLAQWQAWINGIKDLFTAVGLVQTTDTGQLVPADHTSIPVLSANIYGYQVFKFPDSDPNQTARPIFFKIQYGSDNSSRPFVRITTTSGTNGAGTVNSPWIQTNDTMYAGGTAYTTGSLNSYACYVDGTFTCVLGYGIISGSSFNNCIANLVIDRARSATGVALDKGFLVESARYIGQVPISLHHFGPASTATSSSIPAMIPNYLAPSSADGADVNVFRHYMMTPGVYPSLGSLTYFFSEFGALTPLTIPILGSSHTYLPMGRAITQWSANYGSALDTANNHCGMIRWE